MSYGSTNARGIGATGPAGKDGVSPTVQTSKVGTVTTVTITDAQGAHQFEINDGAKGEPGANGKDGSPGATGPAGPNTVSTDTGTNITGLLKGDGATVKQAVPETDYATPEQVSKKADKPTIQTITLSKTNWGSNIQTVNCTGIVTDESAQRVDVAPKTGDYKAYCDAGIYVSAIDKDKLTFTCASAPSGDLTVYVSIQNV